MSDRDWSTSADGRANSSAEFERLGKRIGEILRGSAHSLIHGQTDEVGHLIMAQLAHVEGLAPQGATPEVIVQVYKALIGSSPSARLAAASALLVEYPGLAT